MITSKFLFWWCICNVIINTLINARFVQLKECTSSSSKLKQHNNFATKTLVSRHTVVCRVAKKADMPHFEYIYRKKKTHNFHAHVAPCSLLGLESFLYCKFPPPSAPHIPTLSNAIVKYKANNCRFLVSCHPAAAW